MRTLTASLASLALLCPAAHAEPVHEAIDAYALYQNDVTNLLTVSVDNRATVDAALERISRHNSDAVARGWIAYSALTAAQSPQFARAIERQVSDEGRSATLDRLRGDLNYARQQDGSEQAIRLVLDAASADGDRAGLAGDKYETFARTAPNVQLVASVLHVDLGPARLTPDMLARLRVGPLGAHPASDPIALGGRRFWDGLAGRDGPAPGGRGGHERQVYTPVTNHILTLAAFMVAGGESDARVSQLLNEPITAQCLQMQRLELHQCLSVSVDAGERAYCLGRHGLTGPGACFSAIGR
jgi:hypothetical protein